MSADQPDQPEQHPERLQRPEPPRRVRVNRSPRYGVFLVGGALLGAVVALGLTFSEPATEYGYASTLGYLVVALGLLGALVGGLAAVVAGAVLERQQRRQEDRDRGSRQAPPQGGAAPRGQGRRRD
ncbi:hypothetical protein FHN55_04995 [Streptomyces sp. NP160]|uniref:hypothetical protein n=1 Tax=Streptomyces sp. NP160 TaxID=2586637 RepID=UPI00111B3459|nr:hypothetical protein [Streptomyces sp. NP160]TNM69143.1 hypothetical protein FHN55_04995 [Streptomyces sp. NP160]